MFDFFTSFRLIVAFLIGFIVDEDFRPSDEQIKRIVDEMIDCYVMDMAWVKIMLTDDDNTEELLIYYTVFDDGEIQSTISYNGEDIVA